MSDVPEDDGAGVGAVALNPDALAQPNNVMNEVTQDIQKQQNDLDAKIGFYWWKKYIAGAFWSNIATPISLTITLITALTTGQAITDKLIPVHIYSALSISALIISTLNTFFRPHTQMMENINEMRKWSEFGARFSNIYNNIDEDVNNDDLTQLKNKLHSYKILHKDINEYLTTQTSVQQNFLTDLIHLVARATCLKGKESWLYFLTSNSAASGSERQRSSCCGSENA
jgi:hypothetical protein